MRVLVLTPYRYGVAPGPRSSIELWERVLEPAGISFDYQPFETERLGSVILLDVAVGPVTMVASVEPTVAAKVHERLRLALNPLRLHFFDTESETAV